MNCKGYKEKIALFIDGELDDGEAERVQFHIQKCPYCKNYYDDLHWMVQRCRQLPELEAPSGFMGRLHEKLVEGERTKMRKKTRNGIWIGTAAAVVLIITGSLVLNGLGGLINSKSSSNIAMDTAPKMDVAGEAAYPQEADMDLGYGNGGGYYDSADTAVEAEMNKSRDGDVFGFKAPETVEAPQAANEPGRDSTEWATAAGQSTETDRKIIKSAYLGIETLEFDRTTDAIIGRLTAMGGYVESSNVQGIPRSQKGEHSNRKAHYELRIPKKHFEQFIMDLGSLGNVIEKQENGEDITGQYFDTEARLKTLQIQEERLISILEEAEALQDIIELERELSRIRYEIENYTGTLKKWDDMVDYSRISIDVYEVREIKEIEPEPVTWLDRIIKGFINSVEKVIHFMGDVIVFLVSALPYLFVLGLLVLAGKLIFFRKKEKGQIVKEGKPDE